MKSIFIQLIAGFVFSGICFTIFVFILLRVFLSVEYYRLAPDGSISITPEQGRVYYIMTDTTYDPSDTELTGYFTRLNITSSDPAKSFRTKPAVRKISRSSTGLNKSNYRISFAEIVPTVDSPITLTIAPDANNPNTPILVQSIANAGAGTFIAAFAFGITAFLSMLYVTIVFYIGLYRMYKNKKTDALT